MYLYGYDNLPVEIRNEQCPDPSKDSSKFLCEDAVIYKNPYLFRNALAVNMMMLKKFNSRCAQNFADEINRRSNMWYGRNATKYVEVMNMLFNS